jgi:hypothetical protein
VSSAILYLAIIAIWACILVPRWIHRPHRAVSESQPQAHSQSESASAEASASASAEASVPAEFSGVQYSAPHAAHQGNIGSSAGDGWGAADWEEGVQSGAEPGFATEQGAVAEAGQDSAAEPGTAEAQAAAVGQSITWHRFTQRSFRTVDRAGAGSPHGAPVLARSHILQARRRLLTMLVTLMVASLTCTVTGLSPWWVLVPTGGMLGMYLLLLREAAHADAERARWLAQERLVRAEDFARLAARQAREASQQRPTAEIIDISARVTDQLYDQYADAAVRAVGD